MEHVLFVFSYPFWAVQGSQSVGNNNNIYKDLKILNRVVSNSYIL